MEPIRQEKRESDMPVSLRTELGEKTYQKEKKEGKSRDIKDEPIKRYYSGLKIIENRYPYNIVHKTSDIVLPTEQKTFMEFWTELGKLIENGDINDYDQLIFNFSHKQSQPHISHAHLMKFHDRRSIFSLYY